MRWKASIAAVGRVLEGETRGPDGRPAREFADINEAMVSSARRDPSIERVQYLWFFRLIFTPHALAERMTLVWHSHYATSNQKVGNPLLMLEQNLSQRELWRSRVSKLHRRMLDDHAMLVWLDGLNSLKRSPTKTWPANSWSFLRSARATTPRLISGPSPGR